MINIYNSNDNTNSSNTIGWSLTSNPFISYRAEGTAHYSFQACVPTFDENKSCKIITTKKSTKLLVNAQDRDDEEVFLIHTTGGF